MLQNLSKYKILLASKSPRRRELLQQLRIPFTIVTINGIDESYPKDMEPVNVAQYLSQKKAQAYMQCLHDDELIITADTVVICDDKIFGKPKCDEDAIKMLMAMSGKTHLVTTGVCLTTLNRQTSFSTTTEVTFSNLDIHEIEYYVKTFKPFDKAGAYGIQEWIGCVAVEKISGSFYNVMGLPLNRLYNELKLF